MHTNAMATGGPRVLWEPGTGIWGRHSGCADQA